MLGLILSDVADDVQVKLKVENRGNFEVSSPPLEKKPA